MYAIVGATGNTGRVVAETLLANKQKVRVIGRDAHRLGSLVQQGAEAFVGDVTDAAALTQAFRGTKAVYLMIPPNINHSNVQEYEERVSDALTEAIQKAQVEYAVVLSSIGADKPDRTGPVVGLHNFENKLNGIVKLKALCLRAGYFMTNLLPQVGVIKNFGVVGGPLRDDLKVAMIATQDIGAAAAEALLKLDFTGKQARELLGERDLTYVEAASVIGKSINKPGLGYAKLSAEQLKPAFVQMGMSPNMADLLLEMCEAMNSGYMAPLEARSARNTTPTSLEEFVEKEFAPRFFGKAAGA